MTPRRVLFRCSRHRADIPDRYAFMQPEPVALLERRVGPLLR
ncbi:hypothetical protein ACO2Q2_12185 [Dyella sp. KRB-257]